jgi:hypothetical protein
MVMPSSETIHPVAESVGISNIALEVVSQPRITPEGKAQTDSKAQHTRQYVSISRGLQSACGGPSGVRRGYETTSKAVG